MNEDKKKFEKFDRRGWVKLYRKSLDSSIWKSKPYVLKVFCWCLLKASHEVYKFPFNGKDMDVVAGEFITGINKATEELYITASLYKSAIKYLKSTGRIVVKTNNKFSLIKVVNWGKYQQWDDKKTSEEPAKNQRLNTYDSKKNRNLILDGSRKGESSLEPQKKLELIGEGNLDLDDFVPSNDKKNDKKNKEWLIKLSWKLGGPKNLKFLYGSYNKYGIEPLLVTWEKFRNASTVLTSKVENPGAYFNTLFQDTLKEKELGDDYIHPSEKDGWKDRYDKKDGKWEGIRGFEDE